MIFLRNLALLLGMTEQYAGSVPKHQAWKVDV